MASGALLLVIGVVGQVESGGFRWYFEWPLIAGLVFSALGIRDVRQQRRS